MASRGNRERGRSRTPRPVLGTSTTYPPPSKSSLSHEWKVVSWRPQSKSDDDDYEMSEPEEYWANDPGLSSPSDNDSKYSGYDQEYNYSSSKYCEPRYTYAKPRRYTYPTGSTSNYASEHAERPWPPRRTSYFTPSESFGQPPPKSRSRVDSAFSALNDHSYERHGTRKVPHDLSLDKELFETYSELLDLKLDKLRRAKEDLSSFKYDMWKSSGGSYSSTSGSIADEWERERRAEFKRKHYSE